MQQPNLSFRGEISKLKNDFIVCHRLRFRSPVAEVTGGARVLVTPVQLDSN